MVTCFRLKEITIPHPENTEISTAHIIGLLSNPLNTVYCVLDYCELCRNRETMHIPVYHST